MYLFPFNTSLASQLKKLVYFVSFLLFICILVFLFVVDISIVSLQGYTAAQLATEPVQEFLREGPLTGGTDIDNQLLEAAKNGDLDLVKVLTRSHCCLCYQHCEGTVTGVSDEKLQAQQVFIISRNKFRTGICRLYNVGSFRLNH